jgi:hypothetical protein
VNSIADHEAAVTMAGIVILAAIRLIDTMPLQKLYYQVLVAT